MNVLTVTGHLTADPARRDATKGLVCDFHLAVDGQRRLWLPVTCRGRLAGLCARHLRAGHRVAVSGELAVEYITRDGQKHRRWYTKAERITFLDRPDGANTAGDQPHSRASCHDEQVSPKDGA